MATGTPMVLDIDATFLDDLGGIDAIDDAMRGIDAAGPFLRIMTGPGADPAALIRTPTEPSSPSRLRALTASEAITLGATLILNDLGGRARPALVELLDDTSRVTGTDARVNAYVSERDNTGFGWHWDDHDVVIIQLTGTKHWRIYEPEELAPLRGWTAETPRGREALSILLRPGMGLAIPRGWSHRVSGFAGELSSHLTMSITPLRGRDLLTQAAADPSRVESAAAVVPIDQAVMNPLPLDDAALEHVQGVGRARLVSPAIDDPIKLASARSQGRDVMLRGSFTGGAVFADTADQNTDHVVLAAAGRLIHLPRRLVEPVAMLLTGVPFLIGELADAAPAASAEEIRELVDALSAIDLVRLGEQA